MNPLTIFFIIFILIIIIFVIAKSVQNSKKHSTKTHYRTPYNNRQVNTIDDCISIQDKQFSQSQRAKQVINAIESSKQTINKAILDADSNINTYWLNSYKKIVNISENLESNLKLYTNSTLEQSRFQYYTSLHYRSMIAANIVYKEYEQVNRSFDAINKYIVELKNGKKPSSISKSEVYKAKDTLKLLRNTLLNQVHEMNQRTGVLRDKIGEECGERGRQWRLERLKKL